MSIYKGFLNDIDLKAIYNQYQIYGETRIDSAYVRYYAESKQGQKIHFNYFNPTEFWIEKNKQEGIKEMNKLQMALMAKKQGINSNNSIKKEGTENMNKININPIEKMQQGKISQGMDLTLQKFSEVNDLKKQIDCCNNLIEKQSDKIETIAKDNVDIIKAIKKIYDLMAENNSLLINIATNNQKQASVKHDIIKIGTPIPQKQLLQVGQIIKPIEKTDFEIDNEIMKVYRDLLAYTSFFGTQDPDHYEKFVWFIERFNFETVESLESSISEIFGKWKVEHKGEGYPYAPKHQTLFIKSFVKVAKENGLIENETIEKNDNNQSEYWVKVYGINEELINECIEFLRTNGTTPADRQICYDHIKMHTSKSLNDFGKFYDYLKSMI